VSSLEFGMRVRVLLLPDIHQFLHGATGMVVQPPSQTVMRERKYIKFDKEVRHPYGGHINAIWVSDSMVEVIS